MVGGDQLTAEQAEALRAELAELEGPRRAEVVQSIKKAREFGDLSENFEYHAAKNEQGLLEARIRTLRARLDLAQIVEGGAGDVVGIGSIVDVETDAGQTMKVEVSAVGGPGTVSPTSPLGSALLGCAVGDSVPCAARRRLAGDRHADPLAPACEPRLPARRPFVNTLGVATRPKQRNIGRLSEIAQVAVRHGFGYVIEGHRHADDAEQAAPAAANCARCWTSSARRS